MNKKIKRIVAVALTVSAFSAIAPATNINLVTTKAYAADSKTELTSLKVKGSGTIKLYETSKYKSNEKISDEDLTSGDTYYGKSTSDSIKITTSDDKYVRIFKSSKGYADGKSIPLSSSTTTLKVRLYDEKTSSSTDKDDDYVAEYILKIKYTGDDKDTEDEDDEDYDDIYLDDLVLTASGDEVDFNFKKKTSSYDVTVKESVESIKVKAEPEDDEYKVKIDGSTVDEDDKYRKTVSLNKGKNEIKVKITNDGDERVYTLNVTRGSSSSNSNSNSSNTNTNNSTTTTTTKYNQWVNINGRWQYNDAAGNPLKNTWFYDRNSGQTYYLQADGYMATGWLYNNGAWYYINANGAKQTGWQSIDCTWYYLDSIGKMQTGWFKDMDGKWYYLQSSGAMAKNTTINGYKLGSNGAWII